MFKQNLMPDANQVGLFVVALAATDQAGHVVVLILVIGEEGVIFGVIIRTGINVEIIIDIGCQFLVAQRIKRYIILVVISQNWLDDLFLGLLSRFDRALHPGCRIGNKLMLALGANNRMLFQIVELRAAARTVALRSQLRFRQARHSLAPRRENGLMFRLDLASMDFPIATLSGSCQNLFAPGRAFHALPPPPPDRQPDMEAPWPIAHLQPQTA